MIKLKLLRKLGLINLSQQDFLRHNLTFFVGTLGIAFFNYLYYPVIGHLVSVSDFGEIQAWISLFMEFGIVLTAFGYVTTNIVSNHEGKNNKDVLLVELERMALGITVLIFLMLWGVSHYLKSSFQFSSLLPFVALGALIILNVPSTFRTYFLQGERRLKEVAVSGILFAAGKLVLSVIFLVFGFKLFGVIISYILGTIATLYYVALKTRHKLPSLTSSLPLKLSRPTFRTEAKILKREMWYGLFILILLAIVTILYTSDAIIVRRFFSQQEAGLYSGISSIGRIVYFVTASVAGVLIATVKIKDSAAKNRSNLRKSTLLIVLIGGMVVLAFLLLPHLCVDILIGHKYNSGTSLLPWIGLSMLVASFNNLFFSYQIALRRYATLIPAILGMVVLVALVGLRHATLKDIAIDYLLANFVILVVTIGQMIKQKDGYA